MGTMNSIVRDELTAHHILILQYVSGLNKKYRKIIAQYNSKLTDLIASLLVRANTKNTRTKNWTNFEEKLKELRKSMFSEIKSDFKKEVSSLRKREREYLLGLFSEVCPVMKQWNSFDLRETASELLFGYTTDQRFSIMESSDLKRITFKMRSMFLSGYDAQAITNAIIGVASLGYAGSIVGTTMSYMNTNINTIISGISEHELEDFTRSNSDVIEYEVFVAVLDSKTTMRCAESDGMFWKLDEGLFPPLHEFCRSRRYPLINGMALVDGRFFYMKDGDGYSKMILNQAEKANWVAKNIGGNPQKYTYEDFLRNQSRAFQERMLGKTKAKLFRDGKLGLQNFIDSSGNVLTLDELYSLYQDSFTTAKIKFTA